MIRLRHSGTFKAAQRAGALLCVLLVCLVSLVAVAHVHAKAPNAQERSCSVCALMHSGVAPTQVSSISLVFATAGFSQGNPERPHSLLLCTSFFIRPPPAV